MVTATARSPQQDAASKQAALSALTPASGQESTDLKAELLGSEDNDVQGQAPTGAALVARPRNTAVAPKGAYYDTSGGAIEGQFDETDTRHPNLKIVQGSGPLSEKFSHGTIILGEEVLLEAPTKPELAPSFKFFPIAIKKQFQEWLGDGAFKEGLMPRIVDTIEDVEAQGGTLQWIGKERPSWRPCGRILMLVERPEDSDHPLFSIELDGRVFAPAIYYATGGGYNVIKSIFSNKISMFVGEGANRRPKLHKHSWTFRAIKKKMGDFVVYQPEVRMQLKDLFGPQLDEFAHTLIQGAPEAAETGE